MTVLGTIPTDRDLATGNDVIPPGVVWETAASVAPSGWLLLRRVGGLADGGDRGALRGDRDDVRGGERVDDV